MARPRSRKNAFDAPPPEAEEVVKETRKLFCPLTDEEHQQRGTALAEVVQTKQLLEAEKKRITAHFSEQIKENDAKILELKDIVRDKKEVRDVECIWKRDGKRLMLIRPDTGVVVDSRHMTEQELQGSPFAPGTPSGDGEVDANDSNDDGLVN